MINLTENFKKCINMQLGFVKCYERTDERIYHCSTKKITLPLIDIIYLDGPSDPKFLQT